MSLNILKSFNKDFLLRLHFSIYYLATTLMWVNNEFINNLFTFRTALFFVDITGKRNSLEPESYYFLNFEFLRVSDLKYLVLLLAVVGIFFFLREKTIKIGASCILLLTQLLGYSSTGRVIQFDIVTYGLMGYWAATCILPYFNKSYDENWLRWVSTATAMATTYCSAGIAKIVVSFENLWIDPKNLGIFMHVSKFRHEANLGYINLPDFIVDFFSTPNHIGTVLLSLTILLEFAAVFFIFFRKTARLGSLFLLIVHLGIFLFINILWPPLILFLITLYISYPSRPHLNLKTLTKPAVFIFLFLLLLGWALPFKSNAKDFASTTSIYPFSRFGMYTKVNDYKKWYYISSTQKKFLEQWEMLTLFKIGSQHMSVLTRDHIRSGTSEIKTADHVCNELKKRVQTADSVRFLKYSMNNLSTDLYISVRNIYYKESVNKIVSEDTLLMTCQIPDV